MHAPTVGHFAAVKWILRFVQGTLPHGLHFTPSSFDLHGFSDANWASDIHDRKSISGYCVFLGANLVSWSAKKQATVSRSSTKAEYCALADIAAELCWIYIPTVHQLVDLFTKPLFGNVETTEPTRTEHSSAAVSASVSASAQSTLQPQLQKQATVAKVVIKSTCAETYGSYN
ncbi:hypothetical protein CsSME_00018407 [Camellia sinensis var. sinensis]